MKMQNLIMCLFLHGIVSVRLDGLLKNAGKIGDLNFLADLEKLDYKSPPDKLKAIIIKIDELIKHAEDKGIQLLSDIKTTKRVNVNKIKVLHRANIEKLSGDQEYSRAKQEQALSKQAYDAALVAKRTSDVKGTLDALHSVRRIVLKLLHGTSSPTISPTTSPTTFPTSSPTTFKSPTRAPTNAPTISPTDAPTTSPTTSAPTTSPTTSAPTKAGCDNCKWLGVGFNATAHNVKTGGPCTFGKTLEYWNCYTCGGGNCNRPNAFYATIDFGHDKTINGHRWDVSWVKHENVWAQKIQYSSDGSNFIDANSLQNYIQKDIDNAPNDKIVMNFTKQTARYWRWYVADQNCVTVRSWEFRGM